MKYILRTLIACLIIIPAIFLVDYLRTGVRVFIQNNSTKHIADVVIEYRGGRETIDKLKSGVTISRRIHPGSESSLSIFYRVDNIEVVKQLDIYMEPASVGKLYIIIGDNGQFTYRDEIGYRSIPHFLRVTHW
jgi:hypothetical protein